MNAVRRGVRGRLALPSLPLFVLLLLVSVDSVWALDPTQPANNYLRTRFATEDGLPGDIVDDILQSRDGFLWLRVNGLQLARFDGRHFTVFDKPLLVVALALAPDGDLWLGTGDGLQQIPAAALNQFGRLPATSYHPGPGLSNTVKCLHFAPSGALWVGTAEGLYRFERGTFSLAIPKLTIERIEEASNGHLLLITSQGFMEWDGSQAVLHPELAAQLGIEAMQIFHVFQDSYGVTWFGTAKGVARRVRGSIEKLEPYGPQGHGAHRVYEDPQGNIWVATADGLFRATPTGLELAVAGMQVRNMYGDRDGNLWVSTNGDGLYRFKDRAAQMFTKADGLPNNVVMTALATHDGAVWAGLNCGGLARFDGQHFQTYNEKNGLLNSCVYALAEDPNHDLWVGTFGGGAFRFHDGRFTQYSKDQGLGATRVFSILVARDGSLWFATGRGVSRLQDGQIRNFTMADGLSDNAAFALYQDRAGSIWVGTLLGFDRLTGDRFVNVLSLPKAPSLPIGEDRSGPLYFSTDPGGVLRIENRQPVYVVPIFVPNQMVQTDQRDLWFLGSQIVRAPLSILHHSQEPDDPLDYETFGPSDGLNTTQTTAGQPVSTITPDGKLWFGTTLGLAMMDLPRLPRTDRKPVIYMEETTVGRNQQPPGRQLVLPAGTHHVELNFDAIEITSPEKIRLQYRLDGVDSEWLDASPPGHAVYSTLPPGKHAFHIRACNRSGIWDRVGTVYGIIQQPYFYQTRWFLFATIAFGLLVIAGLYQLRMRQVARTLSAGFEGRLAERTRIARELHDTLLQTFSASLLRFQSVLKMLPARPEEARQRVESVIKQASNAIADGRDAVHELRAGSLTTVDLAQSISNFVNEVVGSSAGENPPEFHIHVEGTPRNLNPMMRDETYRIAAEALRNAVRYAAASKIEVEIRYDEQQLRLRIRDDGKGIDPEVLEQGHAPGHWGLRGMRERAKLLGGNLEVWSKVGEGTEVELTVPTARAYARSVSGWSVFSRGWRSKRP